MTKFDKTAIQLKKLQKLQIIALKSRRSYFILAWNTFKTC